MAANVAIVSVVTTMRHRSTEKIVELPTRGLDALGSNGGVASMAVGPPAITIATLLLQFILITPRKSRSFEKNSFFRC